MWTSIFLGMKAGSLPLDILSHLLRFWPVKPMSEVVIFHFLNHYSSLPITSDGAKLVSITSLSGEPNY